MKVAIVILSIICGLGLAEAVATYLPRSLNSEIHSKREIVYRPEIGIITNQPYSSQVISNPWVYNTISYNKYGFRGPNWPVNMNHSELRIAVIGDSYIEGREVNSDELLTTVLQNLIEQKSEVMNFGLSGTSQSDQIPLYTNFVTKFKPDILIYCVTPSNDFEENVRELSPNKYKNFYQLEYDKLVNILPPKWLINIYSPPINRIANLLSNLIIFKLLYQSANRLNYLAHLSFLRPLIDCTMQAQDVDLLYLKEFNSTKYDYSKKIMEKSLLTIKGMCECNKSRFILVSVSGCYTFMAQENPGFYQKSEYLALRYKWLEQFAEEHSIVYLDLNKAFLELYKNQGLKSNDLHIPWDGHWTPLGHRLAAESIYAFLKNFGVQ